jgi:hypothetical protein
VTAVLIAAGAVIAAGAYLRWAVRPVIAAYRAGVMIGRRR